MRKLSPESMHGVLDAMQLALETGSYPAIQRFITDYEHALISAEDEVVVERFQSIVKNAAAGLSYEKVHGRFSLLKLDHPFNQLFMSQGVFSIGMGAEFRHIISKS